MSKRKAAAAAVIQKAATLGFRHGDPLIFAGVPDAHSHTPAGPPPLSGISSVEVQPPVATTNTPTPVRHSPDCSSVTWHGQTFHFNKSQAKAVEMLWEA